ncbi:PTS sugar transporter subunit IIA [Caenimonas sedimenti]|uniref:PTS sugar transporter subunit IIA n=1 Tax=Caenimonas sedimenti TaxID=2596921 RepID=A0A562ZF25_9BURK|nr:PTS sugar transporter subunit IIA [Caenimonas sedimenti]TWO65522.1 PTS sugar transporter subunit IIA [Caenimonas sedimenti]
MNWQATINRGLLRQECIVCDAAVATTAQAFQLAAATLSEAHGVDALQLVRRLCAREGRRSTVVGDGIATPHADAWGLTRPQAAFVRSTAPIDFLGTIDGVAVHEVLVLVAPRPATGVHSAMLQHYRALLRSPGFRDRLRAAREPLLLWRLFREHEWSSEPASSRDTLQAICG